MRIELILNVVISIKVMVMKMIFFLVKKDSPPTGDAITGSLAKVVYIIVEVTIALIATIAVAIICYRRQQVKQHRTPVRYESTFSII